MYHLDHDTKDIKDLHELTIKNNGNGREDFGIQENERTGTLCTLRKNGDGHFR